MESDGTKGVHRLMQNSHCRGTSTGSVLHQHGWEQVIFLFNTTSERKWSKQQLRNKWDSMRQDHQWVRELLNCTGVEFNPTTKHICTDDEWWCRKIKENNNYKDYKDKDVSDIYIRYHQLFGDTFDSEKYAVTPTKLCRTGFDLFEDSGMEDFRVVIPVDDKSSGSSDEAEDAQRKMSMSISGTHVSGEKCKSKSGLRKGKKKKLTSQELSYSVDRASSTAELVSAKINDIIRPAKNDIKACLEELLATGRLKLKTEMFHYVCMLISRKSTRDVFKVMMDADEKMDWLEWVFADHKKG